MTLGPAVGDRVGRYRLVALIGEGGQGRVFRGVGVHNGRVVAVKTFTALDADHRFTRELLAQSKLRSEHVARVLDHGRTDQVLYLVMEFISGSTLNDLLADRHRVTPAEARRMLHAVGQVLDEAHGLGIVHRDVKLANIMIGARGHVYLIDFGIVHPADAERFTRTGGFIGTLDYMAPERFGPDEPDGRADVYALTVTLFALLTGRLPFSGSPHAIIAQHLSAPVPPVSTTPGVPAALDAVIRRGMAKRPSARYRTAGALLDAVERAIGPAHRRVGRRLVLVGLGTAALVGVAGTVRAVLPSVSEATDPLPPLAVTAHEPGPDPFSTASPDPGGLDVAAAEFPSRVTGDQPGFYGAGTRPSCDRAAMTADLARDPDRLARWIAAVGAGDAAAALAALTPVVLRTDVLVTLHGHRPEGTSRRTAVLQAGTAVLVDSRGVPRVRCAGCTPLTEPDPAAAAPVPPWATSAPAVVVRPGSPQDALTLVRLPGGGEFRRPVGTAGTQDRAVG
jgi:predicted Ser/Thr protein kinase